jgi:peptidoglycan/xylan/chitin deacetylase (PgdA/CDA1 family)
MKQYSNMNHELIRKEEEFSSKITQGHKDYNEYVQDYEFYVNIDSKLEELYDEYYTNIAKLEEKIEAGESDKKIAYLTFDDGPYKLTDRVLDILKENNIKATFFCIGKTEVDDKYQRIVDEGHVLANHTYSHAITKGLYDSVDSFIKQIEKQEEHLFNITGYRTTLMRFPGGSSQAKGLKEDIINALHERGYNYVDWNSETGDGSDAKLAQQGTYEWYLSTMKNQNILVLLMHDYNESTVNNLQRIINDLQDKNYLILPLNNKSMMAK